MNILSWLLYILLFRLELAKRKISESRSEGGVWKCSVLKESPSCLKSISVIQYDVVLAFLFFSQRDNHPTITTQLDQQKSKILQFSTQVI